MVKFRVFHDVYGEISEPEEINYDYKIEDIIVVGEYSNPYKCNIIAQKDGNIYYHFKQGKLEYNYDY